MNPETNADDGKGGHNLPILSVGEISQAVKRTVEDRFAVVRVRGEVSAPKVAASGHCYLRLKDSDAVLDGIIWRGAMARLGMRPEEGMEVIVTGRLTTYPGRSSYQIVIESMELAGEGALLKLLEDRRRKLAAEGLFDSDRKQEIPFLPEVIGVVTSPTGAVIRDILHRLADRFPRHVLLWPTLVQGEGAAAQIAAAIEGFNRLDKGGSVPRPDVLIVARGGGSLEDLWAFNEEVVVRAAAASDIPLISAVGHETDTTLIDYASDRRAPTPSAAAEMAVPVRIELLAQVMDDGARMVGAMNRLLGERQTRVESLSRGLPRLDRVVGDMAQRLDDRVERLANARTSFFERKAADLRHLVAGMVSPKQLIGQAEAALKSETRALIGGYRRAVSDASARLEQQRRLLESVSYRSVLARGFALVTDADANAVTSAATLHPGMAVSLRFHDGDVGAIVEGDAASRKATRTKAKKTPSEDDPQGTLL
ncbi:MAG: exodeoxyribonuclease VII large subunit [Rhodospirillales bacterium]|nr:exodeoxyribonuclease VII large subunit [Rhodospirillales bacterium]